MGKKEPGSKPGINFKEQFNSLKGGPTAILILCAIVFMIAVCVAVFFATVQGAERVLVPDVVGKPLTDSLLELQSRELYPKITLQYSDSAEDSGTILEQDPVAGSIVKAYRRVNLTVSQGRPTEYFEDYVGQNLSEVMSTLDILRASSSSSIEVADPVYRTDESAEGTILEQDPAPGTAVTQGTRLRFVVSSGSGTQTTQVPNIQGLTIQEFLEGLAGYELTFDITLREDSASPEGGSVSLSRRSGDTVSKYTRIPAELSIRPASADSENVQALFTAQLPAYPYPVAMHLDARDDDGDTTTLASFSHPGGSLTIPYDVRRGTTLILYVLDREYTREFAE